MDIVTLLKINSSTISLLSHRPYLQNVWSTFFGRLMPDNKDKLTLY